MLTSGANGNLRSVSAEAHDPELHELLGCSDSGCFAVAVAGGGRSQAILTDRYQVARAEALAHAATLSNRNVGAEVPFSYHDLRREGRMTWGHSEHLRGRLVLGRVVNHQAVCPDQEALGLVAVLGRNGHPVLFIATGVGARGDHHLELLRATVRELRTDRGLRFGAYPLQDLRGAFPQSEGLVRIGDRDRHPLMAPILAVPDSISQAA